jgi:hypothetical protein
MQQFRETVKHYSNVLALPLLTSYDFGCLKELLQAATSIGVFA